MNSETSKAPEIKVQDVLALLKKGYTRYTKDDEGYGNIQAHYNLTGVQVKELFSYPKLKARKTILPKASLNIIDEEELETEPAEPILTAGDVTGLEIAKVVVDELLEEKSESVEKPGLLPSVELVDVTEQVRNSLFS